jgi:hypothetical protein
MPHHLSVVAALGVVVLAAQQAHLLTQSRSLLASCCRIAPRTLCVGLG